LLSIQMNSTRYTKILSVQGNVSHIVEGDFYDES
jgi:hypothetical protein